MIYLRQSTNSQEVMLGAFLDDLDGKTALSALTIANTDIQIWKSGTLVQVNKNSGGGTHIANGYYSTVLDAIDTNIVGGLITTINMSGALPVRHEFQVFEETIYDALYASGAVGLLPSNVTQLDGVTQSLTDLKDFADAGYDPVTNKVQGVVLVDTVTNTPTDMAKDSTVAKEASLSALNDLSQTQVSGMMDLSLSAYETTGVASKVDIENSTSPDAIASAVSGAIVSGIGDWGDLRWSKVYGIPLNEWDVVVGPIGQ